MTERDKLQPYRKEIRVVEERRAELIADGLARAYEILTLRKPSAEVREKLWEAIRDE